jgi:hypothetical protein
VPRVAPLDPDPLAKSLRHKLDFLVAQGWLACLELRSDLGSHLHAAGCRLGPCVIEHKRPNVQAVPAFDSGSGATPATGGLVRRAGTHEPTPPQPWAMKLVRRRPATSRNERMRPVQRSRELCAWSNASIKDQVHWPRRGRSSVLAMSRHARDALFPRLVRVALEHACPSAGDKTSPGGQRCSPDR